MRAKFKREILDPLGPQVGLDDQGMVDTMYVSFLDEEEKKDFRYGEPVAMESAPEETSKSLYPNGYWSGQSIMGAGTVDGINLPRINTNDYPDLGADNFNERSTLYNEFDQNPEIRVKTDFFGAAADVTNDISYGAGASGHGVLPFTMGSDDYQKYGKMYSKHMENISSQLEEINRGNAEIIKSGAPINYVPDNGDREAFNAGLVAIEQGPRGVQGYLDHMDPIERETFVRLNNKVLHSEYSKKGNSTFSNGNLSEFHEEFKENTGEQFDFGNQAHREAFGRFTANKNRVE